MEEVHNYTVGVKKSQKPAHGTSWLNMRAVIKLRIVLVIIFVICALPTSSFATDYQSLSPFEKYEVDPILESLQLKWAMAAEGKKIHSIFVVVEPPFSKEDGAFLQWFNHIHINTDDALIRRLILLKEGGIYSENDAIQSVLQLRTAVRSVVVIIPVVTSSMSEDEVDVLVFTRDVWSLRLNNEISGAGSVLTVSSQVIEQNLLGKNSQVGLTFKLRPYFYEVGALYFDPYIFNSRHRLQSNFSVILQKENSHIDGGRAQFVFDMPLFAPFVKWGYGLSVDFVKQSIIDYVGDNIATVNVDGQPIERKYQWLEVAGSISGIRSFGQRYKNQIKFGYGLHIYDPSLWQGYDDNPKIKEAFREQVMPRKETESFLYVGYQFFVNQFATLYNMNTFSMNELFQLGPRVDAEIDIAAKTFLYSDYNYLRGMLTLSYAAQLINLGVASLQVKGSTRWQGEFVDGLISGDAKLYSPMILDALRLIVAASLEVRPLNWRNTYATLGGDNALRGFSARTTRGDKWYRGNVELRTKSFSIWTTKVGGVLFYDIGAAYYHVENAQVLQDVGIGIRILLPQFNYDVIRVDFGIPLSKEKLDIKNGIVTFGFAQAF